MVIRFLKNLTLSLFVVITAFSSFPAYFLEQGLRVALSDYNVVDRIWLASSDENVVDRLIPFQHVIDSLKVRTAEAAIVAGDGKIFYSIAANTTPRTRDYINSTNSFNVATATAVGGTAIQTEIKASPTQNEMIAGYVNAAGLLQVVCWNGAMWLNEWSVAVGGTGNTRRFDIAYETNSGDAMVMYSTNTATTNELAYRTKPGTSACGATSWSTATNLDPIRTTGIVHWVKLAWDRRAASNLITAIWADANADLSAMVWSGTVWGNEPTAALETALEIVTVGQDVESFDAEYESLSGDVMIVRGSGGTNGTNGGFYSTCTGGTSACTWTARTAMPTILDDVTHLDISANPNTDQILFGAIGNAGGDLSRGVWSGTAWTNTANADTSATTPLAGTKFVATGWLISGANTRGVLVYYDAATTNIGWYTLSGTTWTAQTDFAVAPVFGVQKNYSIETDPINKDRLMFSVNDANSDIHAKRLTLTGTTFAWTNSAGGNPVEANTGSAVYETFDFAYNRFIPLPPVITTYTNTTETALNYSAACTTCGARIGGGAGFRQSVTITGTNFGIVAPGGRSSTVNNIKVGTHQITDANITAWTPTSITFLTDSSVLGDQDTDWGTQYGGALALTVTANTLTGTGANFYVFPQVTSVTQPVGFSADTAREYDAGDTDGVITLNGTRFGSSQGSGTVTVVTQGATIGSWINTAVQVQIPATINDATNTGSIALVQGTGANGKSHTYANTLRVIPRITGFNPSGNAEGYPVTVEGSHFCQGASCPASFDANNKVTFTSAKDATGAVTWSDSTIVTTVPIGAVTGDVVVTSNSVYTSNTKVFILLSTVPNDPVLTIPRQYKADGTTAIAHMTATNESSVVLKADISAGLAIDMALQVEVDVTGAGFDSVGIVDGTVVGGGACTSCTALVDAEVSVTGLSVGDKQWRARVINTNTLETSGWVYYVNPSTAEVDFSVDTTAPGISSVSSGTPGTNSATITWTTDEPATSQVQFQAVPTASCASFVFNTSCLVNSDCSTINPALVTSPHTTALSNLNSGTEYCYRARSKDSIDNESYSSNYSFVTGSNISPAKTTRFHIAGDTALVTNGAPGQYQFNATTTEADISLNSAFVTITGIYETVNAPADAQITVQYENELTNNIYALPSGTGGTFVGYFRIVRRVNNVTTAAPSTLIVTPDAGTTLYVNSADLVMTYSYTP